MDYIPPLNLMEEIEASSKKKAGLSVRSMLLTGFVRTGELIGAKWEEINWEREEWHRVGGPRVNRRLSKREIN